jgi:hypothetical protein
MTNQIESKSQGQRLFVNIYNTVHYNATQHCKIILINYDMFFIVDKSDTVCSDHSYHSAVFLTKGDKMEAGAVAVCTVGVVVLLTSGGKPEVNILNSLAPLKNRSVSFSVSAPWFNPYLRLMKAKGRQLERLHKKPASPFTKKCTIITF